MFRFTKKNGTKAAFRAQVSRKHNMFKRFKKRFNTTTTSSVKRFCKTEATKIVKQLKSFAKQYRSFGLGNVSWITKNYNMTNFVTGNTTSRKYGNRSYSRKTTKSHGRRTRAWSKNRRSRSNSRARRTTSRKSYAW
jgi:hypothetical protein